MSVRKPQEGGSGVGSGGGMEMWRVESGGGEV